jgi:hypothetical protein
MGSLEDLSPWQRIKRRFSLMGGSYKHPDGHIELDFEAAAGVLPDDGDAIRDWKLKRHQEKQGTNRRFLGALMVGLAVYLLTDQLGVPRLEGAAIASLVAGGLMYLHRS